MATDPVSSSDDSPGGAPGSQGRWGRFLFRLAGLLVLGGSLVLGTFWYGWQSAMEAPANIPGEGLVYEVPRGASFKAVADDLAARGIVSSAFYLRLEAHYTGKTGRIKAGEFLLRPGPTTRELLDLLIKGEVVLHSLTLVEGWTFDEMMAAIAAHPKLDHLLEDLSSGTVMAGLGKAGEHPEGRFLPETYRFPKGTSDVKFLARAYDAMTRVLAAEWADRSDGLPYKTPDEALIMASIVEKETGAADERARVAGVFVRRLEKGMRLQTDPTVIYGLGAAFDGDLRRRDLTTDTAYNTYTRHGLPPTPIAMPGRASIHAALHPAAGDALYFVARGDGSHQFSATLKEHQNAVNTYQKRGKGQGTR